MMATSWLTSDVHEIYFVNILADPVSGAKALVNILRVNNAGDQRAARGKTMNKPKDVDGCFDASNCSTAIPRLTDEQQLELAACYAEYCGVDPQDRSEWRTEIVGAKKFVRELMAIWRKREKQ